MGCIFSSFKNNKRVETLLLTTDYCYISNQRFTFTEYSQRLINNQNNNNNQNEYFKINGEL